MSTDYPYAFLNILLICFKMDLNYNMIQKVNYCKLLLILVSYMRDPK